MRVSLVCFSRADDASVADARLDGESVDEIYADLTARHGGGGVDLTGVRRLPEERRGGIHGRHEGRSLRHCGRSGARVAPAACKPKRPEERRRSEAVVNGMDLTRRPAGKWIVDFGWTMSVGDAALYEEPFRWVQEHVYPMREHNRIEAYREYWWRHVEPRQGMWAALDGLSRYIGTPRVAKHRLFVWLDARVCPDSATITIARDDDTTFGILHSRFHEIWSLRLGTSLED